MMPDFGFRISLFGLNQVHLCLLPIIGSVVKENSRLIRAIRVKVFVPFVAFCSKIRVHL